MPCEVYYLILLFLLRPPHPPVMSLVTGEVLDRVSVDQLGKPLINPDELKMG